VIQLSGFPAWWISRRSRLWIMSGPRTSPTSRCKRGSSAWWRSWISFPGTSSAASCLTAWTRSTVLMPWRWHWKVTAGLTSSTPIKAASSPLATSWRGCRLRNSRSAGQDESAVTAPFWWRGCGELSNPTRCTCMPTGMVGRRKSACSGSCGGAVM
jgi:hypothetical protein